MAKQIDFTVDIFNRDQGQETAELSGSELFQLINSFDTTQFETNREYYSVQNPTILALEDTTRDPNNTIPIPFARYSVDTTVGYAAKPGNIRYIFDDENLPEVEKIREILDLNDANLTTTEVFQDALINGEGAELMYFDEYPQFVEVDREQCIFIYDTTIKDRLLFSVRHYRTLILDNSVSRYKYYAQVYYDNRIDYYEGLEDEAGTNIDPQQNTKELGDKQVSYKKVNSETHLFQKVPLYPAKINKDKLGLFQTSIPIIDRLDKFGSVNISDELDKFSQIYILMSKELDPVTFAAVSKLKVFDNLGPKGDGEYVEFLQKDMDIASSKEGFELFERLYYQLTGVPNLNDEKFNVPKSGVAIAYALLSYENKVSMYEMYFSKFLLYRLDLIQNALMAVDAGFQKQNATMEWTRNLPEDMQNKIDLAKALLEIGASKETIFKIFPETVIKDAEEELKKIQDEQKANITAIQEKQALFTKEPRIEDEEGEDDE